MTAITADDANRALEPFLKIQFKGNTYMPNKAKSHKLAYEAESAHNLARGDVTSYVSAFPKSVIAPLDECNKAHGALRTICQSPPIVAFGDTSHRFTGLLTAAYYVGELTQEYGKQLAVANQKLDILCDRLPDMIATAQRERASSDLTIEYPTEAYVRSKFTVAPLHMMISTIDKVSDPSAIIFPADAAQNLVDDIVNRGVETSEVVQNMKATMEALKASLIDSMQTLSARVSEYESGESVRFTAALTKNVTDTLSAMTSCNLFESEDVTKLAGAIEKRMHILKPERIKASAQGALEARKVADQIATLADQITWDG
jgi:hypothetical protein